MTKNTNRGPATVSEIEKLVRLFADEAVKAMGGNGLRGRFRDFELPGGPSVVASEAIQHMTEGDLDMAREKAANARRWLIALEKKWAEYSLDWFDSWIERLVLEPELDAMVKAARANYESGLARMRDKKATLDEVSRLHWALHDTIVDANAEQDRRVEERETARKREREAKRAERRAKQERDRAEARARVEAQNRAYRAEIGRTLSDQLAALVR